MVSFGRSGFRGLVAMNQMKVKRINVKMETSTESFHEAFPDMKSWALRASAGYMCLMSLCKCSACVLSAEDFKWQKTMVYVRAP